MNLRLQITLRGANNLVVCQEVVKYDKTSKYLCKGHENKNKYTYKDADKEKTY